MGVLVSDPCTEINDNHCEQCEQYKDEFLPTLISSKELSKYLILDVGPSKMKRLLNNELNFPQIIIYQRLI